MATEQQLNQLYAALDRVAKVDTTKLLRATLGEGSLEASFGSKLREITELADFVRRYAPGVHNDYVNQAHSTFSHLAGIMENQANRQHSEYIAERDNFVSQANSHFADSRRWRPAFVTAAIEDRGFLEDEGIRQEYKRAVEQLQQQSSATLAQVKLEADKALEEARRLAEEIETRARRTATKISVKDAQEQFKSASEELDKRVVRWAICSVAGTIALVVLAGAFMKWSLPGPGEWPVALYHTLLRLFVLSAVGAVSAFAFRMLRAHMHLAEKNRHRVRVANSVESFVNSALEPQQRDLLLAKLAEAIIDFGDSGMIRGERDEHDSAIVSGDLLGRILAAVTARRP